jgi:hypothetical protein
VLERVVGRSNDLLVSADGGVVTPEFVVARVMEAAEESVLEFRIVQHARARPAQQGTRLTPCRHRTSSYSIPDSSI